MNADVLFYSTDLSSIVSPNELHVQASKCVTDWPDLPPRAASLVVTSFRSV